MGKRNQITIPAAMLRELGVAPGEQVEISVAEGSIAVTKAEDPVDRALGFLASPERARLSDDQLRDAIAAAAHDAATTRYLRTLPHA